MARRLQQSTAVFEDVNLLLFTAWEHGARHVVLQSDDDGMEIRFLGTDGSEHVEHLMLPFEQIVKRLRKMSLRFGRVHVDIGGHQWHFDAVVPAARHPEKVFLHLRPDRD